MGICLLAWAITRPDDQGNIKQIKKKQLALINAGASFKIEPDDGTAIWPNIRKNQDLDDRRHPE